MSSVSEAIRMGMINYVNMYGHEPKYLLISNDLKYSIEKELENLIVYEDKELASVKTFFGMIVVVQKMTFGGSFDWGFGL